MKRETVLLWLVITIMATAVIVLVAGIAVEQRLDKECRELGYPQRSGLFCVRRVNGTDEMRRLNDG